MRLVKEYNMTPLKARNYFFDEAWKWWMIVDQNTRWHYTWKEFEKLFSDKWILDEFRILKEEKKNCQNK